jgi:ESCRT-I complex subunit VPS28
MLLFFPTTKNWKIASSNQRMSLPPYAPVSGSTLRATSHNLDIEVPLYQTPKERETVESLGELYSIISVLDIVEKAYVKDTISEDEYTPTVLKLLAQYNTLLKNEQIQREFGSLSQFKQKYGLHCPQATSRIDIGVPATVEHAVNYSSRSNPQSVSSNARAVAEATGNFITVMDALKLNYRAKDQLHPLLSDLMTSVNKVSSREFEGRPKLIEWLIKINKMNVYDELGEDDSRQLLFDLDNAYKGFYTMLE